jgi:hypothetical protein
MTTTHHADLVAAYDQGKPAPPERRAMPRVERLGVTPQFIALMREVETMRGGRA